MNKEISTIGKIITDAINKHEFNYLVVDGELKLQGRLIELMNDNCYPNVIPVVLFKNLLLSLYIPFEIIEAAMLPTFSVLKSKETKSAKAWEYRWLWENEESLMKYLAKLKELMKKNREQGLINHVPETNKLP